MLYKDRIKAALQQGIRDGLDGHALERHVSQHIGLDQVHDPRIVNLIADDFKKIVWPRTRPARRGEGARLF